MAKCERVPPEGWPGGPCQQKARFDVLYQIRTEKEPRGIRVCLIHMAEMRQLADRGMMAKWDVKDIR